MTAATRRLAAARARIRRVQRESGLKAFVTVVVLAVAVGAWWWREHRVGLRFSAQFTAAVGIYPGSEVRILGVPVGEVDAVTPHGTYVTVAMHLDPGMRVRADTDAVIVSPNLVSDRYVQLTGAWSQGPTLRSGTVLGVARTRTPVELDDLYRNLTALTDALGPDGANSSGALNRLLRVGAANLAGNGTRINSTIGDLGRVSSTLNDSKQDIVATLDQLAQFTDTLQAHDSQLGSVNDELAAVTGTLAADRGELGAALHDLAGALGEVQGFIRDNRAALTTNVDRLDVVAQVLARRRASLATTLRAAPQLIQNFIAAYDPRHNLLRGRADLNELTVWAHSAAAAADAVTTSTTDPVTSAQPRSSSSHSAAHGPSRRAAPSDATAPPLLLPPVGNSATTTSVGTP